MVILISIQYLRVCPKPLSLEHRGYHPLRKGLGVLSPASVGYLGQDPALSGVVFTIAPVGTPTLLPLSCESQMLYKILRRSKNLILFCLEPNAIALPDDCVTTYTHKT